MLSAGLISPIVTLLSHKEDRWGFTASVDDLATVARPADRLGFRLHDMQRTCGYSCRSAVLVGRDTRNHILGSFVHVRGTFPPALRTSDSRPTRWSLDFIICSKL